MSSERGQGDSNSLRDLLFSLAKQDVPEYVFQWFFRYFANGPDFFTTQPHFLL